MTGTIQVIGKRIQQLSSIFKLYLNLYKYN